MSNKKDSNTLDKLNQSVSEIYTNDPLKQDGITGSKKKSSALEFLIQNETIVTR
jgi:hypothetical protein|tara:strand:+ start:775 stop:936 length:162 start_codon:yes stop_codon:yes gene_type:complete